MTVLSLCRYELRFSGNINDVDDDTLASRMAFIGADSVQLGRMLSNDSYDTHAEKGGYGIQSSQMAVGLVAGSPGLFHMRIRKKDASSFQQ